MPATESLNEAEIKFERIRKKLINDVNQARWFFDVFKILNEAREPEAFFGFTTFSYLISTLVVINRLLDKDPSHLHVRTLLAYVEVNLDMFSEKLYAKRLRLKSGYDREHLQSRLIISNDEITDDRKSLSDLPSSSVRKWRNRLLVHINKEVIESGNDIAKKSPIKFHHVDKIIDTVGDILNRYSVAYDGRVNVIGLAMLNGSTKQVIEIVKNHREGLFSRKLD